MRSVKHMIMIREWWKNRKAQRDIVDQEAISQWRTLYFIDIKFPILILDSKGYLAVSDLEEYYIDVDINIHAVNQKSVMIDSKGNVFDFKKINNQQWAPNTQVDTIDFQDLKERIVPLLYMKNHKESIDSVENIETMIDLLLY